MSIPVPSNPTPRLFVGPGLVWPDDRGRHIQAHGGAVVRHGNAWWWFGEDRYFVIVSAYDFEASVKGEQKLLWRTRMSTPRQGVWMQDVVPALVTAGTPLFGRQTELPTWKEYPVREGRVDMGDIKVLDSDVKVPAEKKPCPRSGFAKSCPTISRPIDS